ncbi:hypothetical protein A1O1_03959 [Capronia coronata CBS 617.96]|uniref:DUF7514 domain-containing protein n=1 Tax=Capronia coronata CBS 617.96 TaxID=1182541 RepID=W9Z8P2_9EURO|nr:uncharacterized protein A1O1_03959 [Capronia coronata CBS 617.96]EXJ90854.1 hypothetical protein A1O1_03959 [Capronia coronata CBS 617.96]
MASYIDSDLAQPTATGAGIRDNGDSWTTHLSSSNVMYNDGHDQRPRGSSTSARDPVDKNPSKYQQAHQPINDAVTSAVNNSNATSTAAISPELLQQITAQITASVLQQLKPTDLPPPLNQSQTSGSHMDANSSAGESPPPDRSAVYTPPSPYRTSEDGGLAQPSPQSPPYSNQSFARATSPPHERRAASPLGRGGHPPESEVNQERPSRPKGPKRISTGGDVTTLERVWGTLFDEQGQATERLGQFLRGVATHLIEDYEPKNSLVVTPTKLQRYYEETKLANEIYPWKVVFDDRTSSISRMFREIGAQHHLVQVKLTERPDIPGLTPQGFETWATLLLKAHPDQEFERLAKTALDMPISNPENRRERFPKELSRRLFPVHADVEIAEKLQKAMSTHCNVVLPLRQSSAADPSTRASPPNQPSEQPSQKAAPRPPPEEQAFVNNAVKTSPVLPQTGPGRQREAQTEASFDGSGAVTDQNPADHRAPPPIERERQPYIAAPGAGKSHDINEKSPTAPGFKPPPPPGPPLEVNTGRASSVNPSSRVNDNFRPPPTPVAIHQRPPPAPIDVPETRHRSNSTYHRDQPRPGRNRSPSMAKDTGSSSYMRRSEADLGYSPTSHYPYSGVDPYDDARRYREYEAHRERLANDRYDAARMAAYDPRERERDRDGRDGRPRMGSVSAFDGPQSARGAPPPYSAPGASADEEYYRDHGPASTTSYNAPGPISTGFQPPPSVPRDSAYGSYPPTGSYPPSSYRDVR